VTKLFNLEPQAGEKIWITGDMVIIRATAAETGGAYTMIEAIASPENARLLICIRTSMRLYTCLRVTLRYSTAIRSRVL
jgi:hypothetical protein